MRLETTSWTEISAYRQCPHKHALSYVDGWREPTMSAPLVKGIAWHEVMEHHYRGIKLGAEVEALEAIVELLTDTYGAKDPEHPQHDIGTMLAWMYDGYREVWATDDRQWEVIDVEGEIEVELPSGIKLIGRYDIVMRLQRRFVWVVDHKAMGDLPKKKELDLDDQTPIYIEGVRRKLGLPVRGAMLNVAKTKKLVRPMTMTERFARYPIFRSDREIAQVLADADATAQKAKTLDTARERHPDPQTCRWRCPFTEPCLAGRREPHLERELLLAKGFYKRPAARLPGLEIVT